VSSNVLWSGKPYIRKTIVKAAIIYFVIAFILTLLLFWAPEALLVLLAAYTLIAWVFIALYLYWKWAHTYYVKENSVLITRSWIFGTYQREITFDKIQDVHVRQGIIAKAFKCGSVVFVTTTGLEVGYVGVGARRRGVGAGGAAPTLITGAHNSFLDVRFPENVREVVMNKLIAWREVFQQQKIASAVEKMAEKAVPYTSPTPRASIAEEIIKLKRLLDEGVITSEEFERAKKKLLGE